MCASLSAFLFRSFVFQTRVYDCPSLCRAASTEHARLGRPRSCLEVASYTHACGRAATKSAAAPPRPSTPRVTNLCYALGAPKYRCPIKASVASAFITKTVCAHILRTTAIDLHSRAAHTMLPCTLRSPRSPHTHPRPIPTELLDSVLDHFAASSTALSSFSRVSRAWKHSCYRILFHTIRFKDGPDSDRIYAPNSIPARVLVSTERCPLAPRFDDLLAFLQGAPDVCVHVKQLYLVGTCTPGAILSSSQSGLRLDVLQRVLLMLPKVQVLSLHFLHLLPAIPWSFLRTPTVEVPAFTFGTAADYVSAADEDEDSDAMDTDTDPTPTSQSWPDTLVCRMKLRRLHIGYLDSPPSDASGVVHVLDLLDLFDAIQELNLDCMLIPERALRFALPRARNDSSASASSLSSNTNATQSAGPSLTRRLTPLRVSSLVFGEHCSPTVISLLVNVMLRLLQPDVLSSLDVQLARNSSRFISDILPDLSGFLRCAVRNLRSFTCDISGGRYLRPDGESVHPSTVS